MAPPIRPEVKQASNRGVGASTRGEGHRVRSTLVGPALLLG